MQMRKALAALLTGLILLPNLALGTESKPILYVSGAPSLQAVEHYDSSKKEYDGLVPQFLMDFGQAYDWDVRYLESENGDSRPSKLKNSQADLVTAASFENFYTPEQWDNGLTVLTAKQDGALVEYRLLFTQVTTQKLKDQLKSYIDSYPTESMAGLLLSSYQEGLNLRVILPATAVGVILLGVAIGLLIWAVRLKRRLKKSNADIETDPVTGIGNGLYLKKRCNELITDSNRALYSGIYFLTQGQERGLQGSNAVLACIAEHLSTAVGAQDILARVNDGGFFVLRVGNDSDDNTRWIEQVLNQTELLTRKLNHGGEIFAGIYPLQAYDRDIETIITGCYYSARYAQQTDCRFAEYSQSVVDSLSEEDELSASLNTALQEDQFAVYLQFLVDGRSGAILGAEALSRWNHPQRGLLSPSKYIRLLENDNRGARFDFLMLNKVCAVLQDFCAQNKTFFISCNFMRRTIVMPGFLERFESVLDSYDFPRECLLFEITEYDIIDNTDLLYSNVEKIRAMGVRTVIDDFGKGYSDVLDLGHFIADGVKLDKVLVSGNTTQKDDIVLGGMIRVFDELGITVIAEGIETTEQANRLLSLGCNVLQGYHYYLPMPASEAKRLIGQ